ncbi:hypothetical protein [Thaumasiovibrio subtropicus]|uniref:hypothetical protein n=1 Tax=Thaumasiovibrio subtropicus TaxID=1891207 RepID=UPI00131D22AB|nr:hypothetical protein [Thaumasiovibrio subtropicus]
MFCLHLVALRLPEAPIKVYLGHWLTAIMGTLVAIGIASLQVVSPWLLLVGMACAIFLYQRSDRLQPDPMKMTLRMISLVLVCAIAVVNPTILLPFGYGLLFNIAIAMLMSYLVVKCLPAPKTALADQPMGTPANTPIWHKEWLILLLFMPMMMVFIAMELNQYYVALVTICVMALYPELEKIKQTSRDFVLGNLLGGAIAIVSYFIYTAFKTETSNLVLSIVIVACSSLLIAITLFNMKTKAIAHYALSPFALLLVQSERLGFNIFTSFEIRLLSVMSAALYMVIAMWVVTSAYQCWQAKYHQNN